MGSGYRSGRCPEGDVGPGTTAFAVICGLRDRWREHVRAGSWYDAFEEFVDFYNGPGCFASWPAARRDVFLDDQRARGDLWDVLFGRPSPPMRWRR